MNTNHKNQLLASLALFMMSACGGAGSSSNSISIASPDPQTGIFQSGSVTGLAYETATQSGAVGIAGEYRYLPGERVTFKLGDLTLGSAAGAQRLNIFDIAGVTQIPADKIEMTQALGPEGVLGLEGRHLPLNTAINIGVLLQTLDADQDLDNGIEIPASIAARMSAETLWMSQPYELFAQHQLLRTFLRQATADELLSARPIRRPNQSLDHMFTEIGHDRMHWLVGSSATDFDGLDGNDTITRFQYNDFGKRTALLIDRDADGDVDSVISTAYNADGRLISSAKDNDADGINDVTNTFTYSVHGSLLTHQITDGDGLQTYLDTTAYSDNEVRISREIVENSGRRRFRWGTDGAGATTFIEYDRDGDGSWDRHDDLVYNNQYRWIDRDVDSNFDMTVDQSIQREYNDRGQQTLFTQDSDNDGDVDERLRWRYNEAGLLLELTADDPSNVDAPVVWRETYTYDELGRRTRQAYYEGDSTTAEYSFVTQYSIDDDGFDIETKRTDSNGDDVWDAVETLTYDSGRLVSKVIEDGIATDSPTVTREVRSYDEQGRLVNITIGAAVTTFGEFVAVRLGLAL